MKYSEMVQHKDVLKKDNKNPIYSIKVLSNITVEPIINLLEYHLQCHALNARVEVGQYNDFLQEALPEKPVNAFLVFWEICHFSEYFCYRADNYSPEEKRIFIEHAKQKIQTFFEYAHHVPLILFNQFSSIAFSQNVFQESLSCVVDELNQFIKENAPTNVKLVNIDVIFATLGLEKSIDWRFFFSHKALYKIDFLHAYVKAILPAILQNCGKVKKALILDCDNTLWRGVIGENGSDGIKMSFHDKEGAPFAAIQSMILGLVKKGVLIGLCSKNNQKDVEIILESHLECQIKLKDIAIRKINWLDKVSNLQEISEELNISLDSFVFVDDSLFEIGLVNLTLPEVAIIQVPENASSYPVYFKEKVNQLFFIDSVTSEDVGKTAMYQLQAERREQKKHFERIEDYLASLLLRMDIYVNSIDHLLRIVQLSQKTNQFNLTSKRYSETEILSLLKSEKNIIFTINLSDKFGDYGVSGFAIVKCEEKSADIDTFLISCRIIGREAEYAFFNFISNYLYSMNIRYLSSKFIRTNKNDLVENFYEKCKMMIKSESEMEKIYTLTLNDESLSCPVKHITVQYAKSTKQSSL